MCPDFILSRHYPNNSWQNEYITAFAITMQNCTISHIAYVKQDWLYRVHSTQLPLWRNLLLLHTLPAGHIASAFSVDESIGAVPKTYTQRILDFCRNCGALQGSCMQRVCLVIAFPPLLSSFISSDLTPWYISCSISLSWIVPGIAVSPGISWWYHACACMLPAYR